MATSLSKLGNLFLWLRLRKKCAAVTAIGMVFLVRVIIIAMRQTSVSLHKMQDDNIFSMKAQYISQEIYNRTKQSPFQIYSQHSIDDDNPNFDIGDQGFYVTSRTKQFLEKMHDLEVGTATLLVQWSRSPLSRLQPSEANVCERYANESRQEKVHVLHVWADDCVERTLTLVTQMAINKLPVLERLLSHWTGPVFLALYCDKQSLLQLPKTLMKTNSRLLQRTDITLTLVYQSGEFYPVNYLRNLALNSTNFEYVFLTDVDFMPSYGSYEYILAMLADRKLPKKHAFVVPAFEFPTEDDIVEYPKNKKQLLDMWFNKTVMVFHWKFTPGHKSTDYEKWANTNETYLVKYQDAYEPYIVIDREGVPPYPQEFVGRLGNKIAHLLHVHSAGYKFLVLPDAFLIHYPHPVTWHVKHMSCAKKAIEAFRVRMKQQYPDQDQDLKKQKT